MMSKIATDRYGSVSVGLHWLTLAVPVGAYACINLTELYPKESDPREALETWHFMLGLTVLALMALRLLNRLPGPAPAATPPSRLWRQRLASGMHIAPYGLMLILLVLGWPVLSAAGAPIPFFSTHLPALLAENGELADQLEEVHDTRGTVGYFLTGAHAPAALFHHFAIRDHMLACKLPRPWRRFRSR